LRKKEEKVETEIIDVLVVDGDRFIRNLVSDMLKKMGYDVETASTPEEAVWMCQRKEFKLVIAGRRFGIEDLKYGEAGGLWLAKKLRGIERETHKGRGSSPSSPPVILMSGDPERLDEATKTHFAGIIGRPFSAKALGKVVKRVLTPDD
jgi:CheY-like chemotaxis protein